METFEEIYKDCNESESKEPVCYYCESPLPTHITYEDCDGHKVCYRCFVYLNSR